MSGRANLDGYLNDNQQLNKIDEKIIQIIKKAVRPLSKREIANQLKLSPATTGKYVDILVAKGILNIQIYGNIHLVSSGGEDRA